MVFPSWPVINMPSLIITPPPQQPILIIQAPILPQPKSPQAQLSSRSWIPGHGARRSCLQVLGLRYILTRTKPSSRGCSDVWTLSGQCVVILSLSYSFRRQEIRHSQCEARAQWGPRVSPFIPAHSVFTMVNTMAYGEYE